MADGFTATIEPDRQQIRPDQQVTFKLTVFNSGQTVDEYSVQLLGLERARVNVTPQRLSLLPGSSGVIQVGILIPRDAQVVAGDTVIGLKVQSVTDAARSHVVEAGLEVVGVAAATLTVEPRSIKGGSKVRMNVTIDNGGNSPATYTFAGDDPEKAVTFRFTPPAVTVAPFSSDKAQVEASAKRAWLGSDTNRALTLNAVGNEPLTTNVMFVQQPLIGRLMGKILLGLAVVAGLLSLLLIPAVQEIIWPPETTTTTIPVAAAAAISQLALGQPDANGCAELTWATENATAVELLSGDGKQPLDESGSLQVCGDSSTEFTLRAVGPGGTEEQTLTLDPKLVVLDNIEVRQEGTSLIWEFSTNISSTAAASFGSASDESADSRTHRLELPALESGRSGEWEVTVAAAGNDPILATGQATIPFVWVELTLTQQPVFEEDATPPGPGPDFSDVVINPDWSALVFELVQSTLVFEPPSTVFPASTTTQPPPPVPFVFVTAPEASYLGVATCPVLFSGDAAEAVALRDIDPAIGVEIGVGAFLCPGTGDGGEPLPEGTETAAFVLFLEAGKNQIERELVVVVPDGTVTFMVKVVRVVSDTPPGVTN